MNSMSSFSPQILLRQEHHPEDLRQALRLPLRVRPRARVRLQPGEVLPAPGTRAG